MDDVEIKEKSTEQNGEMEEQNKKRLENLNNRLEEAINELKKIQKKIETEADGSEAQESELLKEMDSERELTDRLSQLPALEDVHERPVKCYSSGGNSMDDISALIKEHEQSYRDDLYRLRSHGYINRPQHQPSKISVGKLIISLIVFLGGVTVIIYGIYKVATWLFM
jgi:chromosome segregation ATPase